MHAHLQLLLRRTLADVGLGLSRLPSAFGSGCVYIYMAIYI